MTGGYCRFRDGIFAVIQMQGYAAFLCAGFPVDQITGIDRQGAVIIDNERTVQECDRLIFQVSALQAKDCTGQRIAVLIDMINSDHCAGLGCGCCGSRFGIGRSVSC